MPLNLPNTLTLSRLALIAVMMALLALSFPYAKTLAFFVFVLAGLTDYLDGWLARRTNAITAFGQLMDPLADKVMVCAAFVSFVEIHFSLPGRGMVPLVPAWIVVVIVAREFLVTGLRLLAASRGQILSAGAWGKQKTVWQIVAILIILAGLALREDFVPAELVGKFNGVFYLAARVVALGVAAITVVSGALYFHEHRAVLGSATPNA